MLHRLAVLVLAFFAGVQVAAADLLSEVAGRYSIEPGSSINMFVPQVGGGGITGTFTEFNGTLELDRRDLTQSSVTLTLSPASVTTGQDRVDRFLKSSAVFDVAQHPKITFRSSDVVRVDTDTAEIRGDLTARDKTLAQTFRAQLVERRGRTLVFHVVGEVPRALYGMGVGIPIYSTKVRFDMTLRCRPI